MMISIKNCLKITSFSTLILTQNFICVALQVSSVERSVKSVTPVTEFGDRGYTSFKYLQKVTTLKLNTLKCILRSVQQGLLSPV